MTDIEIVAFVLAWTMPPTGMPDNHPLYHDDRKAGWTYLTEEGFDVWCANSEAVDALYAKHAENVQAWAAQAVAQVMEKIGRWS